MNALPVLSLGLRMDDDGLGWLLVSAWVSYCATPILASFVVLQWTSKQFMTSVA